MRLAADAACLPVRFRLPVWASALAAADLADFEEDFERRVRLAALAAFRLFVRSRYVASRAFLLGESLEGLPVGITSPLRRGQ